MCSVPEAMLRWRVGFITRSGPRQSEATTIPGRDFDSLPDCVGSSLTSVIVMLQLPSVKQQRITLNDSQTETDRTMWLKSTVFTDRTGNLAKFEEAIDVGTTTGTADAAHHAHQARVKREWPGLRVTGGCYQMQDNWYR